MKEFFKKISQNAWKIILFASLATFFLVFDLVSKQIVIHNMKLGDSIDIIPNFFHFTYSVNDGMAFSMNFNAAGEVANQIIFISISVIGTALISFLFFKTFKKSTKLVSASLGLMLAGCVGNLIDRIFYSKAYLQSFDPNVTNRGVVDFIDFQFGSWHFATFNVADSCLVIGVLILIVYFIIEEVRDAKKRKKKEEEAMPEGKVLSKDEKIMIGEEEPEVTEEVREIKKEQPLTSSVIDDEIEDSIDVDSDGDAGGDDGE